MGYSRRDFVNGALEELGLANYVFDMEPEQLQSARRRLDALMAFLNAKGVRIGYPLPSGPDSDLDEQTAVPDRAYMAIVANLAIRVAPMLGKTPSPETALAAKAGLDNLFAWSAQPPRLQRRTLPAGAGNKPWRYSPYQEFIPGKVETLDTGPDGELAL